MMHYEGNIFRPPVEHDSVLLQITTGCPNNQCLFCGMYKDKTFRVKDESVIFQDIRYAAERFPEARRLFLCDGDALAVPMEQLVRILREINRAMPGLTRIGSYANAISIRGKSPEDLKELKKLKLAFLHMGLESGDDKVLAFMGKGIDAGSQVEQGRKVRTAGIRLSVTVLLGLGGRERSEIHAEKTGRALTVIDPNHVGALSLMIVPEAPLSRMIEKKEFILPGPMGILKELRIMAEHTDLTAGIFSANHSSNYLPLQARFPAEKAKMLAMLDEALAGRVILKPEFLRGL